MHAKFFFLFWMQFENILQIYSDDAVKYNLVLSDHIESVRNTQIFV